MLLSYLYYGFYKVLLLIPAIHNYAAFIATLLFYSLFDHPHIFQTFSRTHADPIEFQRRKGFYTVGVLGIIAAGYCIQVQHWEMQFEAFMNIYGIWHILRQNSGFLKLYKKRAAEKIRLDTFLDFGFLYASVVLLLAFRVTDSLHHPLEWLPRMAFPQDIFLKIFWAFVVIYAFRQLFLLTRGRSHYPKLIFMIAIISTYYFTYITSDPPFGLLVAIETIYHDVQYQGWISHFQKRRFGGTVWRKWFVTSLIYGALFGSLLVLTLTSPIGKWLLSPFLMLVLFHYFIDARIWRFSKNPELKALYS